MFEKIKELWKKLDEPVFEGERLESHLKALTYVSAVSGVLGLIMAIINTLQDRGMVTFSSYAFFIGGVICTISAGVYHKRQIVVVVASVLCAFIFTYYLLSGETEGTATLWSIVMPIGICYFISVKYGIILSIYYELLIIVVFYTPIRENMVQYYSESFMVRYPIIFFCVAIVTIIGMTQYHFMELREIEYTERLKKEITTQKKITEELAKLTTAQNKFFAAMSHEIRTPINAIIGFDEMILRENVTGEVLDDAQNIQSASKLLLHLINDILDISKIQSGMMEISVSPYGTEELLTDVAGMFAIRARQKRLELIFNINPDIPSGLVGDEVRIKQILINLVNNSIKYTYEGSITVSVCWRETEAGKGELTFKVADTGIGIKKEDIPFLFNAYHRADEDDTKHIEGTGLGLSIVKQFVSMMDGEIKVDSVYGKGSIFTVSIPQGISEAREIGAIDVWRRKEIGSVGAYRSSFEAPNAHILIVDDTPSNILVAQKLLRSTKARVDAAENGFQALDKTLHRYYDIILLDHFMPNMDGIECIHRIREQKEGLCRDSKIVALTANAVDNSGSIYFKEGFDGFLQKPFTGEQLEQTVYKLLPQKLMMEGENSIMEFMPNCGDTAKEINTGFNWELDDASVKFLETKGIYVNDALMYCGNDKEIYLELLKDYVETVNNYSDRLDELYRDENWADYKVLIHGIKSFSKMIGIRDLAEKAKQLEYAARDGEIAVIRKNHAAFLVDYRKVYEDIKSGN